MKILSNFVGCICLAWVNVLPADAQALQDCKQVLAASGAVFTAVPQPSSTAECQVPEPVRMTAVKTHSGLVNLPDQPVFSCSLAVAFASFLDKQAQPLALQDMRQPLVAIGTGPGFDCRDRKGDTTIKLSEHGTANAADISAFTLANHTQVLVKDAASPTATDFAFLQNVRAAACVSFTTVLGPGANPAHAEHFHVDLAQRKGGYRICE